MRLSFFISTIIHVIFIGSVVWIALPKNYESLPLKVSIIEIGSGKNFSSVHSSPKNIDTKILHPSPFPLPQGEREKSNQTMGNQQIGQSGNSQHAGASYEYVLASWLNKFKVYPEEAKQREQEGTVAIKILITRDGVVKHAAIVQSSGIAALDNGVQKMVEEANPFPAIPSSYEKDELEFVAPIRFQLE